MSTQRRITLSQSTVVRFGWLSVLVAVALPFGVSLIAAAKFRDANCSVSGVYFGGAPLIAACEPVEFFWIAIGWLLTATCVFAVLGGIASASFVAAGLFSRPLTRAERSAATMLLVLIVGAIVVVSAVVAVYHDTTGPGGLIFLSSTAAVIFYVAMALARVITKVATSSRSLDEAPGGG